MQVHRIISLKDGKITDDTNPYDGEKIEKYKEGKTKKTSMNFFTALGLSLNNLMTKKGRTILTAFAGSIGIIGISLILSLSKGVNNYIEKVQEDTLTSYPLTIEKQSVDMGSVMASLMDKNKNTEHEKDAIYSNDIMTGMMSTMYGKVKTNNLVKFKEYLEKTKKFDEYVNDIKYTYKLDLQIYKDNLKVNPSNMMSMFGYDTANPMGNAMTDDVVIFNELSENKKLLESQYDILKGRMPKEKDELVLIIDKNNEINDFVLYSIGLKDQAEIQETLQNMVAGNEIKEFEQTKFTYDEILDTKYKLVLNSDYYVKQNGIWIDSSENPVYMKDILDDSLELKIVGIIKPKEDSNISLEQGVGYTKALTEYVVENVNNSDIAKEQKENKNINVFTGAPFTGMDTADTNLQKIGVVDLDNPYTINLYPKNFESKDEIEKLIKEYNDKQKSDDNKIEYTDFVGLLINSITTIVNVIGYVLIAFVSISLVVSSIMIGIITYISVLERTKEIGILRAIGASKKDISRVFNAETFIIGLFSGVLGTVITCILNIFINIGIKKITGVTVSAVLPIGSAIVLIIISTLLTLIGGLIPSKIASKKDPVIALRTE